MTDNTPAASTLLYVWRQKETRAPDIPDPLTLVRRSTQLKAQARIDAKTRVWMMMKQTPAQMAICHFRSKRSFTMRRKNSRTETLRQQVPIRKRNSESQAVCIIGVSGDLEEGRLEFLRARKQESLTVACLVYVYR